MRLLHPRWIHYLEYRARPVVDYVQRLGWAATDQNEHHNFVAFFELPIFLLAFCRFLSLFCRFFCRFFVGFFG
jgi:hypothetical protein